MCIHTETLPEKLESSERDLGEMLEESLNEHRLNEMASISSPSDGLPDGIVIWVYGEKDEQATKTPHFHVVGKDFEFEVYIRHIHNLDIWRTKHINKKSNSNTWNERANIRKAIREWLDKPNAEFEPLSNAHTIVAMWNSNNSSHKIPQSWKN